MKVLNRNQQFNVDLSMRGARAAMTRLYAGLTLAGGTQARLPVAIGPRNDLDSLDHGAPCCVASRGRVDAAVMLVSPGDTVLVSERRF